MLDQAALRRLVLHSGRPPGEDAGPLPRRLVLATGKPGQGATTLAINLAVAMAGQGSRTILIDADFGRADVALCCGLAEVPGIAEVLAGKKSIHEALQRGPGGIQVVAGAGTIAARNACSSRALDRLLKQVLALGRYADTVLIDTGVASEPTLRFWTDADEVLLVTSPDAVAVMDTYATLKTTLARTSAAVPVRLVVNQAESEAQAFDVHCRIEQSCRRFLGLSVPLAGWIPLDPEARARNHQPITIRQPDSHLASAIEQLAEQLLAAPEPTALRRAA